MGFEKACTEMYFILNNLSPEDLNKIPVNFVSFFKENMDKDYKHKLTNTKPLYEQELTEETKAFIKIIYINYLAAEEKKLEAIKVIKIEEEKFKEKYKFKIKDNIFEEPKIEKKDQVQEMVVYKENKFMKFLKKIFKRLK